MPEPTDLSEQPPPPSTRDRLTGSERFPELLFALEAELVLPDSLPEAEVPDLFVRM